MTLDVQKIPISRSSRPRKNPSEILRRRARIHDTPLDRYQLKVARSARELEEAFKLLHEAYVECELEPPKEGAMRITPQHVLAESLVVVAYEGTQPIGTITSTRDSPAGLPLDKDYPNEITRLRRQAARLAEIGSLAVASRWRSGHVTVLLCMTAHWIIRNLFRSTHTVIGVNPTQEGYYRAVYNFQRLGPAKDHAELSAPVVGLFHNMEAFKDSLTRNFRIPMLDGRLPHEHFCTELPHCVEMPRSIDAGDPRNWKLPRRAFREIFIHRSKHLYSLDSDTRRYLQSQRGPETLQVPRYDRFRVEPEHLDLAQEAACA